MGKGKISQIQERCSPFLNYATNVKLQGCLLLMVLLQSRSKQLDYDNLLAYFSSTKHFENHK